MSGFDDRKKGFEEKYAHQEKLDFAVEARTCKLFGIWAAKQLGLSDADAPAYASSVVAANLEEAGFDDVLRKVRADFAEKGLSISDHVMNVELDSALSEARRQVNAE